MVVGFNHNVRYGGELYHVQTEDSGLKNPFIITHLYRGGTIIASKKVSYADITKVDALDKVIEELMKEQHKEVLRRLKNGEYDEVIAARFRGERPVPERSAPVQPKTAPAPRPKVIPAAIAVATEVKPAPAPAGKKELSLDDLVLSYLTGDDE